MNENAHRLIGVCPEIKLRSTNGYFKYKEIHKYTRTHQSQNQIYKIVYVIVKQETRQKISDAGV